MKLVLLAVAAKMNAALRSEFIGKGGLIDRRRERFTNLLSKQDAPSSAIHGGLYITLAVLL